MANAIDDYYHILGIKHGSSDDDIKRSYKKLAVKYHPDKTADVKHHELFIKIQEAYETLKDPIKRKQYDRSLGINVMKPMNSHKEYFSNMFASGAARNGKLTGYFGMYQQFYKTYDSPEISRKKEAAREEQARRDRVSEAAKAAKLAKDRIDEKLRQEAAELKRRQEQERRDEINRQQRGRGASTIDDDDDSEELRKNGGFYYGERKRDAFRKEWENAFSNIAEQQDILDQQYYLGKQRKDHENVRESRYKEKSPLNGPSGSAGASSSPYDYQGHGNDYSDPIVLDDEEGHGDLKNGVGQHRGNSTEPNVNRESSSDSDDDEFVTVIDTSGSHESDEKPPSISSRLKDMEHLFNASMNLRPRQEPAKVSQRRRSASPTRQTPRNSPGPKPAQSQTKESEATTKRRESSPKRRKSDTNAFSMGSLQDHLGTDIGLVDFSEMLDSLPNNSGQGKDLGQSGKNRKISENNATKVNPKRPRLAEFVDGTSKADTIHIPVNKSAVKGFAAQGSSSRPLTMLDLGASPSSDAMAKLIPPPPPQALITNNITKKNWDSYVKAIDAYVCQYMAYKNHIIQYQFDRHTKDQEYFDVIHANFDNFEVYQQCLDRDMTIMKDYTELLRNYIATMSVYRQNCNWIKMASL